MKQILRYVTEVTHVTGVRSRKKQCPISFYSKPSSALSRFSFSLFKTMPLTLKRPTHMSAKFDSEELIKKGKISYYEIQKMCSSS